MNDDIRTTTRVLAPFSNGSYFGNGAPSAMGEQRIVMMMMRVETTFFFSLAMFKVF